MGAKRPKPASAPSVRATAIDAPLTVSWLEYLHKHRWKVIGILMLVAFFFRIYRIGFLSLWVDEYIHALPAKQYAATGIFEVADNNGILLTMINCLFVKLFGLSEFVLRLPLALSGTLLVPVAYFFGKKLFSLQVGLITAMLVTFSPYLIFWSRVDRMYEFVSLFYLITLILFWRLYENKEQIKLRFFSKQLTLKKTAVFILLLICFLFALLSQVQAILFLLTVGFYGSMVAVHGLVSKNRADFRLKKYKWLLWLTIIGILLFFTPLTNLVSKPIIDYINHDGGFARLKIPGWIAGMLAPDWKAFGDFIFSADWNKYFRTYYVVTKEDYPLLAFLGWLGFAVSLFYQRKPAYYLIAAFLVPLIAMSFFLREPNEPRYLCFIYPVFLCSTAVSLSAFVKKMVSVLSWPATNKKKYAKITTAALAVLIAAVAIPYNTIYSLIGSESHGHQLKLELGGAAFVNWKEPGQYVKEKMQPGDLVFSTVKIASDYYTDASSFSFRQYHYDLAQKKYVPNNPRPFVFGANSYDEFVKTIAGAKRGWLLLDHYLYSEFIDERIIEFIHQNCTFYPMASQDGSVQVFGWDKSQKASAHRAQFVLELGKQFALGQVPSPYGEEDKRQYSSLFFFNACANCDEIEAQFYSQGIDYTGEAAIIVNGEKTFVIPKPVNNETGESSFNINTMIPGQRNQFQFVYTPPENEEPELAKGFYIKTFYFRGLRKEIR